jgi:DNA uptake protein ComE-like DNA-binding protein
MLAPAPSSRLARGSVLLVVLVVIAMLTLATYTFCDRMLQHRRGASVYGRQLQAEQLAASGCALVQQFLSQPQTDIDYAGGIYDNPEIFSGVLVLDDSVARGRGRFAVVASRLEDAYGGGVRFGLEDEAARINVNMLLDMEKKKKNSGRTMLLTLPGMTEEVADAILDWIDPDDEPRQFGAEADYYASLTPGYAPRNGPLLSVEELLLVRDVTPDLLYGADMNHNGTLDAEEAASPLSAVTETMEGDLTRGWAGYLTLYSVEKNTRPDGTPKIDLNQSDLQTLYDDLTEVFDDEKATFVIAYRQNGASTQGQQGSGQSGGASAAASGGRSSSGQSGGGGQGNTGGNQVTGAEPTRAGGGGSGGQSRQPRGATTQARTPTRAPARGSAGSGGIDFSKEGKVKLETVLDLIGARVEVPGPDSNSPPEVLESPFSSDPSAMGGYLLDLVENTTTDSAATIRGRININQAPREVLLGLPEMTEEIVTQIVTSRVMDTTGDPDRQDATWLLSEGVVTLEQMKSLLPYVNAGGDAFRTQLVGYYDEGGPVARIEVVLDATSSPPQLLLWREMSHLGYGFSPEILGVQ